MARGWKSGGASGSKSSSSLCVLGDSLPTKPQQVQTDLRTASLTSAYPLLQFNHPDPESRQPSPAHPPLTSQLLARPQHHLRENETACSGEGDRYTFPSQLSPCFRLA
ncbi:hypothetical protein LIA77_11600 [Sarocladium implicatum]|nr:hypothetical protein LIA77_11600 [Sarocladium implicatum]